MADVKKPTPKPKSEHGKPASGCFRVISFTYKGFGKHREKIYQQVDIKKSDKVLPGDPESKIKQMTLLEAYKAKAENPNSRIEKVIE